MRNDPLLGGTPLVLLSAFGAHLSLVEYTKTGCDQVVYKPFQSMELFSAIQLALHRDEEREPTVIPVMYRSGECDLIEAVLLEQLIRAGEIDCFRRRNGLVMIGQDPVRSEQGGDYAGRERRFAAG